ncbi:MAG TPA: prepilin-type N-terminal cleavage/methylation domain-containing protein [Candidatus Dependentiae bacterium]|nr:prepilin-type N-terminal cleavage/methylation domain-containing protein [Candidatus Dependentiae bacterium]
MSNRRGFTLIELLVYTVVTSCLVITVMHFTSIVQRNITMQQNVAIVQTGVYASLDSLARACAQAPSDMCRWVINEPSSISWVAQDQGIGFEFKHGDLMRISRSKDRSGSYKMSCSSLLIPRVKGSFHVLSQAGYVMAIEMTLHAESSNPWSMTRKFLVRSGRIT